jgi:hypothetical protein
VLSRVLLVLGATNKDIDPRSFISSGFELETKLDSNYHYDPVPSVVTRLSRPPFSPKLSCGQFEFVRVTPFELPFRRILFGRRDPKPEERSSLHATTVNENLMLLSHCERIEVLRLCLTSAHDPNPPKEEYSALGNYKTDPTKAFIRRVHTVSHFAQPQEFKFVAEDDEGWCVSDFWPLQSAATLTTFSSPIFENDETCYDTFDIFTNLKVLKFRPLLSTL